MQLVPNLVIADRFRLNRVIGRGGMGSVWHATHLGLDIPCAVKFIEGNYAAVPEAQTRFEREAKAAAHLRSPHVVQILDHGVWQGVPYLAMEMLEGEDLGQRLKRVERLPPKDLCVIVSQVARALTKAHSLGIVHRDLKPDNIFLVRDDDREIAKVLDFGIAKLTGAVEGSSTKTGAMLGTPYYMSPEQAQGTKAVDHRSDLWSMGVIVFRALTGALPFESTAIGDLLMRIIVGPIPVPSLGAPWLPPSFDRWWAKAASRDPSQRFQSARELADDLLLAFGHSQLTDVMDRAELRALQDASVPFVTPNPIGAPPVIGTLPVSPVTPQPGQPRPFPVPYAMEATPQPMPSAPHGMTGAPIAHTFGNSSPRSRVGLYAGVSAAVVVVLGTVAVVGTLATRPRATGAAASPSPPPATVAAAPVPPVASASLAPVAPPVDPTASAPSSAPTAAAPSATATTVPTVIVPRFNPGAAKPAAPAAPAPKKKPGDVDLGI
jgi:serine/threonine-protein kinase